MAITFGRTEATPARPVDVAGGAAMWSLRPPGVYRPQNDTWLLAKAMRTAGLGPGTRVLDLCTGTGVLAATAAAAGAEVTAVDMTRRAVLTAWTNARLRGLSVRVRRGRVPYLPPMGLFDLVLANPPYVPCPPGELSGAASRCWDAGPDGRAVLDPLCAMARTLLAPGGRFLMVHSAVCDERASIRGLTSTGLRAWVMARGTTPFGPVMRSRAGYLEDVGLIARGVRTEQLVVVRAERPDGGFNGV